MPVAVGPELAQGSQVCSPWATVEDLCLPCSDLDVDAVQIALAFDIASDVLFNLTGRRWPGLCMDVIRPCGVPCGSWATSGGCGCPTTRDVRLPRLPVSSIISVLVDGAEVPVGEYALLDGRDLIAVRQADGSRRRWPSCQDMSRPSSEEHTFEITYEWGSEPPAAGARYAATLACELYLACQPGNTTCRLPDRVTSITRQGVSMAVLDPLTLFSEGRTGLREVDLWVESVRYGDRHRRAAFIDPLRVPSVRRGH